MGKLSGKSALVTGAASGIGLEIARSMAREGAAVAIADVASDAAKAAASALGRDGARAIALTMDVTNEAQVEAGSHKRSTHSEGSTFW